jgi:site-specific recombinase XerD
VRRCATANARRDWFDRAAVLAGVDGLIPHELRHTAARLAVSAGANVKAVQRMLGHYVGDRRSPRRERLT